MKMPQACLINDAKIPLSRDGKNGVFVQALIRPRAQIAANERAYWLQNMGHLGELSDKRGVINSICDTCMV
jgi:hypothetical protein